MRQHKGRVLRVGVAAMVAAVLTTAGCSGDGIEGDTNDRAKDGAIEIAQWYHEYGEEGTREAVERYAEEYNKSQDQVHVTVTWVPGDYESKLNTALLAGEGPDVFESAPIGERIFAGQVAPVDSVFGDALSDFNPKNIEAVTVDGHIYGVPMSDGDGLLFYRKSMLEEANVQPPATLDELKKAADQLSTGERKGLFIGNDGCTSAQMPKIAIWSSGTELIADGKSAVDVDRAAAVLEGMKDLCTSPSLLLGAPSDWYDSSSFIDGLAAMQWGGQWTLPAVEEALGDDFGVVPWPALDSQGTPATWFGGWYSQVNAASKNVDAAKDYVKWLWVDNIDAQTEWSTAFGSTAPVRTSITEATPALREPPASEFVSAIADYGHLESGVWWTAAMQAALGDAFNNVIRDGADAKAEATKLRDAIQAEIDRVAANSKLS
ncbi:MAG: extracellular solute-binding protein [Bifidobacteriaceae bacterium]|jgi:multiple sugar transport system substrate-binding protein|nr:extracellular solute-binding protein [Bifidobacteriaceae bacterium]